MFYNLIYIDIYIYHHGVFNLVIIMTENKKYYYFTFVREKDKLNEYNTFVTDEHPVEFVIKQSGEVMILYSIEITKEQFDNFVHATRNR